MKWQNGQHVWFNGKMGTIIKVHEQDGLLAVRVSPGIAKAWPIHDSLPVDRNEQAWKARTLSEHVYWGVDANHGTIAGWIQDKNKVVIQEIDGFAIVSVDEMADDPEAARRIAWFTHWESKIDPNDLKTYEENNQWGVVALYWEFLNDRNPLGVAETIRWAAAWRRNGEPVKAIRVYCSVLQQWPDHEPYVLAGLAACLTDVGSFGNAARLYKQLEKLPENHHKAVAKRGLAHIARKLNQPKDAAELYKQAKQLNPEDDKSVPIVRKTRTAAEDRAAESQMLKLINQSNLL